MDSPIRQQLKRNDYQRHKLFRKMARRRKAKKEQEQKAAEKELRRKLRIPRYEDGKPTDTTWMSNWLTKRADKILENMGDIPSETFDRFNTATAQQQLLNLLGTVQKTVQEVENKAGVGKFNGRTDIKSNPRTITIAADAPAQTVVHELTHALASPAFGGMEDSLPLHQKISLIYKEDGVHSVAPTTTKDGRIIPPDIRAQLEKYINSPEEIYGRLNELRYGLGLNPTYIVTPEDVLKWRAAGKFDRFWRDVPDSTILRLFNEVAQQAVPIRDDGVYVAKGGKGAYGNMKRLKQPRYADGKPIGYYTLSGERKQPTASDGETVDQIIDLSEFEPVVTMYRDRLPMNGNRRFVSDYDEYGFHSPHEVFDPDFVQTPTESRRTNTTNLLHTVDPYGQIPLNAGAFSAGLLAGLAASAPVMQLVKSIGKLKKPLSALGSSTPFNESFSAGEISALYDRAFRRMAIDRLSSVKSYPEDELLDLWLKGNIQHVDEIDPEVMEIFENTVIPRLDEKFLRENGGVEGVKNILREGGYNVADEPVWNLIYGATDSANSYGMNYDANNGISVRGWENLLWVLPHELRHRLQRAYQLLKQRVNFRKTYLNDAYGSDFANLNTKLPETDKLHTYTRFADEAETTNLDSRNYLFDNYADKSVIHQGGKTYGAPIPVLNKIIDAATDEQIIESVRNANGYGRRYIEWLMDEAKRKVPEITTEEFYKFYAPQFRNAMKYVPAFAGAGAVGASAISAPLYGYKYGKASGIHIKPENRGKFTALKKRTGKSASWFKAHGTPALKKMATFALNARKWKHKYEYGKALGDPPSGRRPLTFLGSVAKNITGSDNAALWTDGASGVLGFIPGVGTVITALDLGHDVNDLVHGDGATWSDVAWDVAGAIPFLKKGRKALKALKKEKQLATSNRLLKKIDNLIKLWQDKKRAEDIMNYGLWAPKLGDAVSDAK